MRTFLSYVAEDIVSKYGTDLSRTAVVFPNKRASLFLNRELHRLVDKPLWSPVYITISDFFRAHSSLTVADPIKLVCELYKSFIDITDEQETLDHFYGWGQLLIADFDDIDKNMADPSAVLANVKDLHAYDDVSYLTDEQKQMLRRFFSNFSEDPTSRIKKNFLRLWSKLYDIYGDFNHRLEQQGLAYEGALYRQVAETDELPLQFDRYIFVGFNVLQRVEQKLFGRIKEQGKAFFYWDFDRYYIKDNEAGHYIDSYLTEFPNELDNSDADIYDNFSGKKDITFAEAPTANIQAKYVAQWLKEKGRATAGSETVVVMADETLLPTVIHSLPTDVEEVNITTGFPLSQTPVASFVGALLQLYAHGRADRSRWRLHYVNLVLRHPFAALLSDKAELLAKELNSAHIYYPRTEQLCLDDGLTLIFGTDTGDLLGKLADAVSFVARNAMKAEEKQTDDEENVTENGQDKKAKKADPLLGESLFRAYTLLNRLHELRQAGDLNVTDETLERLIFQLIRSTSIPFHGEPAQGLQVMGVLETRNLDFKHVLLLSCNEGNLPKGVDDSSFIPHAIRKAYGLTTVDYKVAVYAYYFYRLLQRAEDVTIVYSNAVQSGKPGEMSRFMLQLMVESGHDIKRLQLKAGQTPQQTAPPTIKKDADVIAKLQHLAGFLSPTAINHYLRCPLIFYYSELCGIKEPNDDDENRIDNRTFGNIFHLSAQMIYKRLMDKDGRVIDRDIYAFKKQNTALEAIVDEAFKKELFNISDTRDFHPEYNGLQLINRKVILHYLQQLLDIDARLKDFRILGLEKNVTMTLDGIEIGGKQCSVTVGGYIDRLDKVGATIRVIDYKTGSKVQDKLYSVEDIFESDNISKHSDYYFQAILYSIIVRRNQKLNPGNLPVAPGLLFIQHAGAQNYDPTLEFGTEKIVDVNAFYDEFMGLLRNLVAEIFNPQVELRPTSNRDICRYCAYRVLCGRM